MKEFKYNIENYKKELLIRTKIDTELYLQKLFTIFQKDYEKFRIQKRKNN